jgi:uncharacterized protein
MVEDARLEDNTSRRRYELWLGDTLVGSLVYRSRPNAVALVHTQVEPAFEGQGIGGRLVAAVLDDVRSRGLKIVPICRFVQSYLERHPEHQDLIASTPTRGV